MPLPALLLVVATLLPLLSFIILMFWGKRMGNPFAGYFGTAMMALSFACSVVATIFWMGGGRLDSHDWGPAKGPINIPYNWLPTGGGGEELTGIPKFLQVGVYVDSLTVAMFFMITLVSTLVFIFSIGYMAEDKRFPRFFTYLGLFCFSQLGLVLGRPA